MTTMIDETIVKIVRIFSHYSREQKIAICKFLSYLATVPFGGYADIQNKPNNILPWNAETLITIILMNLDEVNEPQHNYPSKEFDADVLEAQLLLKDVSVPPFSADCKKKYSPYHLLGPLFIKQISYQRYVYAKLYRFNYIFSYDETMRTFFKKKTGVSDYFVYAFLGEVPTAMVELYPNKTDFLGFINYQSFIEAVVGSYSESVGPLVCDLSVLAKKQSFNCDIGKTNELLYAYKSICERPIIQNNGKMIPIAPHCLDYACTEGLLLNVTTSEKSILDHIGPILETYLYHLLEESGLYELPPVNKRTKKYKYLGFVKDPPDAIAKTRDAIVIFECKAKVYKRKIFINDDAALSAEYGYVAEAVKQLLNYYKHVKSGIFDPFGCKTDKDKEIFLVLSKLFYIPLNVGTIIQKVLSDEDYKEYGDVLQTHLLITDIDAIELFLLHKKDFIAALKTASKNGELASFNKYRPSCASSERTDSFKAFMSTLKRKEKDYISLAKATIHKTKF